MAIVQSPDFLEGTFPSSGFRVPVTLLRTNACSPLARNALAGDADKRALIEFLRTS